MARARSQWSSVILSWNGRALFLLPLLGTKCAGAGSELGTWCGPLAEVGDGDAWVRARCGLGIIAETVRSGDVAFGYGGKNSVTDERNFATNH